MSDHNPHQGSLRGMRGPGDAPYRSPPSTPRQWLYARCLMDQLELSSLEITLMHRLRFIAAGFTSSDFDALVGRRVDDVLPSFSRDLISRLIREMEREVKS